MPQSDRDQYFLGLVSEIPGVTVSDPAAATASGRQVCIDLQDGDETRADIVTKTMRNTPNGTIGGATAILNVAIAAYCPEYGG